MAAIMYIMSLEGGETHNYNNDIDYLKYKYKTIILMQHYKYMKKLIVNVLTF